MAAALPFIAVGMMVLGTVMSAAGAQQDGRDRKAAADFNASVADRNAGIARAQAAQDAAQQQRDARRQMGAISAGYGASGVAVEGSPLEVLASSAYQAELDRQTIIYKGELRAMGYQDESTLERFGGETALAAGDRKAASTILLGGSQAASMGSGMFGKPTASSSGAGRPILASSGGFG